MSEEQMEFNFEANPTIQLQTEISAKFVEDGQLTSERQTSLDALNINAEEVCNTLQPIFQQLIIEMLELKRQAFATGGNNNAGS